MRSAVDGCRPLRYVRFFHSDFSWDLILIILIYGSLMAFKRWFRWFNGDLMDFNGIWQELSGFKQAANNGGEIETTTKLRRTTDQSRADSQHSWYHHVVIDQDIVQYEIRLGWKCVVAATCSGQHVRRYSLHVGCSVAWLNVDCLVKSCSTSLCLVALIPNLPFSFACMEHLKITCFHDCFWLKASVYCFTPSFNLFQKPYKPFLKPLNIYKHL